MSTGTARCAERRSITYTITVVALLPTQGVRAPGVCHTVGHNQADGQSTVQRHLRAVRRMSTRPPGLRTSACQQESQPATAQHRPGCMHRSFGQSLYGARTADPAPPAPGSIDPVCARWHRAPLPPTHHVRSSPSSRARPGRCRRVRRDC